MKMLATRAILADEVWVGNILPLQPDALAESITFSMPVGTPGLSLWSRKPIATNARSEADAPFSVRFDETDAMLMFDEVKVPWERVFVHNDSIRSRGLYIETPAHAYGNHHSNVRFSRPAPAPRRARKPHCGGERGEQDPHRYGDARPPRRA